MGRKLLIAVALVFSLPALAVTPVADVDLGKCSATFKVTNADGAPVANANVHLKIERSLITLPGFFTIRNIVPRDKEVQLFTDEQGEGKIVGLPAKPKKPLVFDVSKSRFMSLVVFAPEDNCDAAFNVKLE